jgi:NAD(P)-dependent dehydrogenase (short-subunit alcohol dehydrogenase family)
MEDLKDKVVILTGATGGVGKATAQLYASYGVKLVLADLKEDALKALAEQLNLTKERCLYIATDISDDQSVKNLVQRTVDTFGRVDILVNNAGFSGSKKCLSEEYDIEMAKKVLDINSLGTFRCMQQVLPIMRKQQSGVIVNTASVAAERATPFQAIYAASKAAVVAMTKAVAWEYGPYGIRAIAVGPSAIDTHMINDFATGDVDQLKKDCADANPLGRIAKPSEIANLIVFLSSNMASFMTGFNVLIDGGNRK